MNDIYNADFNYVEIDKYKENEYIIEIYRHSLKLSNSIIFERKNVIIYKEKNEKT